MWKFLRRLGKAVLVKAPKFVLDAVGGGLLIDAVEIAKDVWQGDHRQGGDEEATAELQALAQLPMSEVRKLAGQIAQEIAADEPEEVRRNLAGYLAQVPAAIRRSLRRPSDPTGTTTPPGLVLRKAEDLLPFVPTRLPRFKEGDYPIAGVDLEVVELLGIGGYGEVWKARNPYQLSDPPVALKFCLDPAAAASLRHEAALLDRVKSQGTHGGIVKLLRTYLRADPPCLEYEYVEGGDLGGLIQEWHRSKGGVSPQQAAKVMLRLAEIVGFAHRLNPPIVHRDLKPANVLVQKKDKESVLKVADFGIGGIAASRVIAESRGETTRGLVAATVARGSHTPLYASAQQMAGKDADTRDDVYSLGVIWFQLLTGDLLRGVGADYAEDLREAGVDDDRVIVLLGQCVAAKAERRPVEANDLAEKLSAILQPAAVTVEEAERRLREENFRRWKQTAEPRSWIEKHQGQWSEEDRVSLLEALKRSAYWPMRLEDVWRLLEDLRKQSVEEQIARAEAERRQMEYDRAIADCNEAIRLDPKDASAFHKRGNAWHRKEEYDKAIADYNKAIRLKPKYVAALVNRGNAWKAKEEYDRAIADYDEAIRLNPKFVAALVNLTARHFFGQGDKKTLTGASGLS